MFRSIELDNWFDLTEFGLIRTSLRDNLFLTILIGCLLVACVLLYVVTKCSESDRNKKKRRKMKEENSKTITVLKYKQDKELISCCKN